jgi:hypothetical protein
MSIHKIDPDHGTASCKYCKATFKRGAKTQDVCMALACRRKLSAEASKRRRDRAKRKRA